MAVKEFFKKIFLSDFSRPRYFLAKEEGKKIQEKIKAIEKDAHSRIVIHVIRNHKGNLYDRALKEFSRHRLYHPEIKTGVLVLISLKNRQFQLLGDEHIHEKLGEEGWNRLAGKLSQDFKDGKYFEGLDFLLDDLGEHLRTHFPKFLGTEPTGGEKSSRSNAQEEKS